MLNVYWVLFLCVPDTLAAPCVTCYGFQPGCTFETNGKCPMADIPVANLAITAKAGVGGALILQNAVSNKYNRVINREGLNSLQALMRRPFNGTPKWANRGSNSGSNPAEYFWPFSKCDNPSKTL